MNLNNKRCALQCKGLVLTVAIFICISIQAAVTLSEAVYAQEDDHEPTRALGLRFTPINNFTGYEVSWGYATATEIVIPETYNFLPVVKIANWGFTFATNITSVTIPSSVTEIGLAAFESCRSLACVNIPDGVSTIGSSAFAGCYSLTDINIPESVTDIGGDAFAYCHSLTSITLPSGITVIAANTFVGCESLTSIRIPVNVMGINEYAFAGCEGLTSINIPSSVSWIEDRAFSYCTNLSSITVDADNQTFRSEGNCLIQGSTLVFGCYTSEIPNSVTDIGQLAFWGCTNLTSIDIPDNVTTIGFYAFGYCSALSNVTLHNSDLTIGNYTFLGCTSLTEITIPSGKTCIEANAFSHCYGLTSITIPNSVTSIGDGAFSGCRNLNSIIIPESVSELGLAAFDGCSSLSTITIPNSITSIGSNTFTSCERMASIYIPSSVTVIAYSAFDICPSLVIFAEVESRPSGWGFQYNRPPVVWGGGSGDLSYTLIDSGTAYQVARGTTPETTIIIPDTYNDLPVTQIADGGFQGFQALMSITLPSSITRIENNAFRECAGLTNINIPNGVVSIGDAAFDICTSLSSVFIPSSVLNIGQHAFSHGVIYTEFEAKPAGWADNWKSGAVPVIWGGATEGLSFSLINNGTAYEVSRGAVTDTIITIPSVHNNLPVTSIASNGFCDLENLMTINIPDSITNIGRYAFSTCPNLTEIHFPNSVTSIAAKTIFECENLTSIFIGSGVTSIEDEAFYRCTSIASIIVDAENPVYRSEGNCIIQGSTLVLGCKTSEIPNTVTSIGNYAFSCCYGLTSINLPDGITSIGDYAFDCCFNLKSVNIPSSVTSIGRLAFRACENLVSIFIPCSVVNLDGYPFYICVLLFIFTEHQVRPEGWDANWNLVLQREYLPVMWGATTDPVAPSLLRSQIRDNNIHLVWEPPMGAYPPTFLSYAVYRDGYLLCDTGVTNPVYTDENPPDGNHSYYVTAIFSTGESEASNVISATSESDVVAVGETRLSGNYPNPFNPSTTIAFYIVREGRVVIEVYNVKGQKVSVLVDGVRGSGEHKVVWNGLDDNGRSVGSGVYFYRMMCEEYIEVRKMVMVK